MTESSPPPAPGAATTKPASHTPGTPATSRPPLPIQRWNPPGSALSTAAHLAALLSPWASPSGSGAAPSSQTAGSGGAPPAGSGQWEVGESSRAGALRGHSSPRPAAPRRLSSTICTPPGYSLSAPASTPRLQSIICAPPSLPINSAWAGKTSDRRGGVETVSSPKWTVVASRRRRRAPPVPVSGRRGYGGLRPGPARERAELRRAAFLRRFWGCCLRCLAQTTVQLTGEIR